MITKSIQEIADALAFGETKLTRNSLENYCREQERLLKYRPNDRTINNYLKAGKLAIEMLYKVTTNNKTL